MQQLDAQDARTLSDYISNHWDHFVEIVAGLEDRHYDGDPEGMSDAVERAEEIHNRLNDLADSDLA